MSAFISALVTIVVIALVFIGIGILLMSRMVGGFGNLRALYRLFRGFGRPANQKTHQRSAKTSSSRQSSHSRQGARSENTQTSAQSDGKMFGQNEGTYVDFEEVK